MIIYGNFQQAVDLLTKMHIGPHGKICDPIDIELVDFMNKINTNFIEFMPFDTKVEIYRSDNYVSIVFKSKPEIHLYCSSVSCSLRTFKHYDSNAKEFDLETKEDVYQFLIDCKKLGRIKVE